MSGGHFDYGCFRISQFADELDREIRMNKIPREHSLNYCPNFKDETISQLKECHRIIEMAGKLAKEVEWLYSGDTEEETFEKAFNEHVKPALNLDKQVEEKITQVAKDIMVVCDRSGANVNEHQTINHESKKFVANQEYIDVNMPCSSGWDVVLGRESSLIIGDSCRINCMEGSTVICGNACDVTVGPNCYVKGGECTTVVRFDISDIICLPTHTTILTNSGSDKGFTVNVAEYGCYEGWHITKTMHKFSLYGEYATIEQLMDTTD